MKKLKKTKKEANLRTAENMAALNHIQNSFVSHQTLLSRVASAEKSAVRECVDFYGSMIWSLAKKHTGSEMETEQAVREIFNDIWRNAAYCDVSMSDEKSWIALIAWRRLSEYQSSSLQLEGNNVLQYLPKTSTRQSSSDD